MATAESIAYTAIRSRILEGILQPGDRIVQEQIGKALGVSRTPVILALKRLEGEHLVYSETDRGFFVSRRTTDDMVAVYMIREGLEPIAARQATHRADEEFLAALRTVFRDFTPPIPREQWPAYLKADRQFHRLVIGASGNPYLGQIMETFSVMVRVYSHTLTMPPGQSYPQHMAIIEAIEMGAPERAEDAMRAHMVSARQSFVQRL